MGLLLNRFFVSKLHSDVEKSGFDGFTGKCLAFSVVHLSASRLLLWLITNVISINLDSAQDTRGW